MAKSSNNNAGDGKQPAIFCDMCTEEDRRTAVKTCMKCEISMCVEHLQPHLTKQVFLLSHPLTEPRAEVGLGGTKCPQHGKLIEYYCLDDLTSVCVSCAIEDQHRLHNMKTLPKAHAELAGKLAEEERGLAAKRKECEDLRKWEQSQREEVSRSSLRLIEAVSKLRDVTLNRVQSSVSARTGCVTTCGRSIQAAKSEKDTFRFLQLYSQVQQDVERAKAVDPRKGLEPGQERDKLCQELQKVGAEMLDQATKLCGSVLMFVDPENQGESPGNATFDPLTLGLGVSLSADHRKAFYNPQSGTNDQFILTIKDANSVRPLHRWKISVSEEYDWAIGLCEHAHTIDTGFVYALCMKDDQLSYLKTDVSQSGYEVTSSHPMPGVRLCNQTVTEVCWNPQASSLSFFTCRSPHYQRRLLVSIDVSNSSSALNPFVQLQSSASNPFGSAQSIHGSHALQSSALSAFGEQRSGPPTIHELELACLNLNRHAGMKRAVLGQKGWQTHKLRQNTGYHNNSFYVTTGNIERVPKVGLSLTSLLCELV